MPCTVLEIRRGRVRRIRRRVVGGATAVFVATTGSILVQLSSGHDPALARTHTTTHPVSTALTTSSKTASADTSSSSRSAAPVTTRQS